LVGSSSASGTATENQHEAAHAGQVAGSSRRGVRVCSRTSLSALRATPPHPGSAIVEPWRKAAFVLCSDPRSGDSSVFALTRFAIACGCSRDRSDVSRVRWPVPSGLLRARRDGLEAAVRAHNLTWDLGDLHQQNERPLGRVAVVGGGIAGLTASAAILGCSNGAVPVTLFEQLWDLCPLPIASSNSSTISSAIPIRCAAKKAGDQEKFSASCAHHSFIGIAASRSQVRQPAIAMST
jgi:hypothetical protein